MIIVRKIQYGDDRIWWVAAELSPDNKIPIIFESQIILDRYSTII